MLHSLLAGGGAPLHIHLIVDDDVTLDLVELLAEMSATSDAALSVHRVPSERRSALPDGIPAALWNRIFLGELLLELDRVLFLDADLIVLESLRPLWELDLQGRCVGAVTGQFPGSEWGERHCAMLGLARAQDYFAAGVMVIDLDAWRELDATTRVAEFAIDHPDPERAEAEEEGVDELKRYLAAHPERTVFFDQDALNAVLAAHRLAIAPRWNVMNQVLASPSSAETYGARALDEARRRPAIRHFEGPGPAKPWDGRATTEDRELYWRHRNGTAWGVGSELPHPMQEFFAGLRQQRRERSPIGGNGPGASSRAVVTIVQDEPVMLPIWLGYYERFFDASDIYVLDHQTSDGSTDREGFVRVPVEHDRVDHSWMVRTIEDLQHQLLDSYGAVLVTDVDEIVAPAPGIGTLGDYVERLNEDFVNCLGYEILHLPESEPPLDPELPIMAQRNWWYANDGYDKPALATAPMSWVPGFHTRTDGRVNIDPDLRLVHLHRADHEICLARHQLRARRNWHDEDLRSGWATHNRIAHGEQFERWFYEDSSFDRRSIRIQLEPIPAAWKEVF